MEKLWTPWRMTYVGGERKPGCVFCNAIATPEDRESLVLHVGDSAFMLLNRFPYNSGHLMIVPIEHVPSIEDLSPATRAEMMEMANMAVEVARPVFRCDGFNIGMNIGQVAGAGIADHLHMHLVPRWTGDANFMPILSDTMVLPETLASTHARLKAEIATTTVSQLTGYVPAAGALVFLPERGTFALRKVNGAPVVLPKGRVEKGETAAEAAIREVREETGVDATIVGWIGRQVFKPPHSRAERVQHSVFFLATGQESPDLARHLESDTILVKPADLLESVQIPDLRDMIAKALPAIRELTGDSQ